MLPAALTSGPDRLARFQREAEVLASQNHQNIGAIYGLEEADGIRALVLELVEGDTLADRLQRGPVPVAASLTMARQNIDALDAAHEKGIVHRDLKPANIQIATDGVVKMLDFGLAKAAAGDRSTPDLTQSPTVTVGGTRDGVILGTAAYMSPEQARGRPVDKRADLWAFGCVLYEMFTGRAAFARETISDTIAAILEREPDWTRLPEAIPPAARRLLQHGLQKDLKRRLRDIGDARVELDDALTGAEQAQSSVAAKPRRWPHALTAAALVTSIIAISMVIWNRTAARQPVAVPSLGPRFVRVTTDTSFSTEPALSADGTLAAYASDRGGAGQLDLWLQRVAGGQPIRLTDDPSDDREPDFSPDGNLITFRSDRGGGGIYVMPTLGGNARLVAERGRAPRFSPDGMRIAYWTGSWLGDARTSRAALFVVPSIGGPSTRIADGFVSARNPIWSPDGRSILFIGRKSIDDSTSGAFDWWWTSLDTREAVPTGAYPLLTEKDLAGLPDGVLPARWTTQGVLFSGLLGESVNLWRVKISQRSGKVLGDSLERLTHGAGSDVSPSADAAGRMTAICGQLPIEGHELSPVPTCQTEQIAIGHLLPLAR